MSTIKHAIKEMEEYGEAYYQPVGAMLTINRPMMEIVERWEIPDYSNLSNEKMSREVRKFYDAHADYFADGYWLCLHVDNDSVIMEVGDEY